MKLGWVQLRGAQRWRYAQSAAIQESRNDLIGGVGVVPTTGCSLEETWSDSARIASSAADAHPIWSQFCISNRSSDNLSKR